MMISVEVRFNRSTQFQTKITLLADWPGLICHLLHLKSSAVIG